MKIRIKGNSIRFRLTKTDVNFLYEQGELMEKTQFPNLDFRYGIRGTASANMSAEMVDNAIVVNLPMNSINTLFQTEQIGFEETIDGLKLLVEKDFTCLDKTSEDQSDNYPNPNLTCK